MPGIDRQRLWRSVAGFLLGCAALALVTWAKLAFDIKATGGLLYLPIIVLIALTGEILPAIGIAVIAAGCLDFFFTEPRFSFQIGTRKTSLPSLLLSWWLLSSAT
jgi:two-component system, LuxR family, sensor kinase FixL